MQIYSAVCLTLLMVAAGAVTVVLIQTLLQVKRTARSMEILSNQLNGEVSKWKGVSDTASLWATTMAGSLGKTTVAFLSGLRVLMNGFGSRKDKKESSHAESGHERS